MQPFLLYFLQNPVGSADPAGPMLGPSLVIGKVACHPNLNSQFILRPFLNATITFQVISIWFEFPKRS